MKKNAKRAALAVFAALLCAGAVFAGGKSDAPAGSGQDTVKIQLKWLPQAQFMGYYTGESEHLPRVLDLKRIIMVLCN